MYSRCQRPDFYNGSLNTIVCPYFARRIEDVGEAVVFNETLFRDHQLSFMKTMFVLRTVNSFDLNVNL